MALEFRVLGPLEVVEGERSLPLGGAKQRALLAILLLHANEPVSVDALSDALWGGHPPATAAKMIQGYVSQLRKVLGGGVLVTHASGYRARIEARQLDALRFDMLVKEAAGKPPDEAAARLQDALRLWRGDALADFAYETFAQAEIARLAEARLSALEARIDADLARGCYAQVVPELEALLSGNPYRERLLELLMLALYRSGRQADALEAYRGTQRLLDQELGLEPGPRVRELQQRILTHDPELQAPRRPVVPPQLARRGSHVALAGALIVAAAAAAAGWELTHGGKNRATTEGAGAVVALDPRSGRADGRIPFAATPSSLSLGPDALWALGNQTIERIDPRKRTAAAAFATTSTPTDLAVVGGGVWVVNGRTIGNGTLEGITVPASVSRLDPRSAVVTNTITLPTGSQPTNFERRPGVSAIAIGRDAVWAIDASGDVVRISPSERAVVATVTGLDAQAIAVSGDDVWVDDGQTTLASISARTNHVTRRISLTASGLGGITVGGGAIWVADPEDGDVWRVTPGPPVVTRTITVGIGVTALAFGDGAVWATNPFLGTISRIDPATGVVRTTSVPGTPEAITAGQGKAWASVNPVAQGPEEHGVQALPAPACGPIVSNGGRARFLIASDLPLRGSTSATVPMTRAIAFVLEQHGFRAGRYTVGYQSCDDSTAQSGNSDFATCGANARAYAADPDLIGLIGTFNSGCAIAELPSTSRTPSGPLAMISPLDTDPDLTHQAPGSTAGLLHLLYPTGARNFVRIIASDDAQGAADAKLAQELRLARVYVLDDGTPYGRDLTGGFLHAAEKLGLTVAGVSSSSGQAHGYGAVVERIQRSRAAGVFIAGLLEPADASLLHALRARFGAKVKLIAGDGFLTIPELLHTVGPAADGMYVSSPGRPNELLPAAGRSFVHAFAATQASTRVTSYSAAYAAQAAQALLAAIARSDGTRASVTKQLFATRIRNGVLGSFAFTKDGDMTPTPVTIFRVVGGNRPSTTYEADFAGAVVDRVVEIPLALAR